MAHAAATLPDVSTLSGSAEGVLIIDRKDRIVSVSPALARRMGYQPDDLAGEAADKIIPGIRIALAYRGKTHTGGVSSADEKMQLNGVRKDTTEFKAEITAQALPGGLTVAFISESDEKQDQPKSAVTAENTNRDLHLQIQKRRTIEKKMLKLQRLYDTMVHNFPDGVIGVLDRNMRYILIDGKDLHDTDLPSLGLAGGAVSKHHDPELAQQTLSKIKKAFEGENVSFEVKTGKRCYHISAVPLPDEQNNINEILCVLKNITEKNRLEDELVKALEKEKELGDLKSRFVTMACHEFKTPLATILSSVFLLENYSGEDYVKEKGVHTNRIRRSVNNLTMILNEFLSLEKLEGNKVKVFHSDLNLPRYINDLICEIEAIKQKGQQIEYHHTGEETIHLDPHLLWSIVTNLISNALKYSREGDKISVTSEFKENTITITVKDPGMGIPEEEHKHIFGRFNRARNAMNFEGTGLGLHIVEKNVKLFNGTINFTSQLNEGTEFRVVIPNGN
jgi:PAS domain S-box-containing protein